MVAKKGRPSLSPWTSPSHHILGHGGLGDVDAEHQQLAVNMRSAPEWVGQADLTDQIAQFIGDLWPPGSAARAGALRDGGNPDDGGGTSSTTGRHHNFTQ